MRVIAGSVKGKKILPVPGTGTRPTTDRVKESLFSILQHDLKDKIFLDLFAGTGAIGIEALSRGVKFSYFIELEKQAYHIIKQNLESTGFANQAECRKNDAFTYLKNTSKSFDIIYIDPPQFNNMWTEALQIIAERPHLLNPDAMIIVKMHPKEYEEFSSPVLKESRNKKYGSSLLAFYNLILL